MSSKQEDNSNVYKSIKGGYTVYAMPSKSIWLYPDQQNGAFWKNIWVEILRDQIPVYMKAKIKTSKKTYILGEKIKVNTTYEIFKK